MAVYQFSGIQCPVKMKEVCDSGIDVAIATITACDNVSGKLGDCDGFFKFSGKRVEQVSFGHVVSQFDLFHVIDRGPFHFCRVEYVLVQVFFEIHARCLFHNLCQDNVSQVVVGAALAGRETQGRLLGIQGIHYVLVRSDS